MAGRPRKVINISTGKIGKEKIKSRLEQEKKIKIIYKKFRRRLLWKLWQFVDQD